MKKPATDSPPQTDRAITWVEAILSSIPYVLFAYDLFLLAVEWHPIVVLLLAGGLITWVLLPQSRSSWRLLATYLGDLESTRRAALFMSGALISWTFWYLTHLGLFSFLAILTLIASLALIVQAQHVGERKPS